MAIEQLSVSGKFETALSNGQVLADDGTLHNSVQNAENNATDYLFIGPDTFAESVTITTDSLSVIGAGQGSVIDGGGSSAINIDASNINIRNLACQNNTSSGSAVIDIKLVSDTTINTVTLIDGDVAGIVSDGDNTDISNVTVEANSGDGFNLNTNEHVHDCVIKSNISGKGVNISGDSSVINNKIAANSIGVETNTGTEGTIISSNIIRSSLSQGIVVNSPFDMVVNNITIDTGFQGVLAKDFKQIIGGNIIDGAGFDGIDVQGTDQLIYNNAINSASGSKVKTTNATNPTTDVNI